MTHVFFHIKHHMFVEHVHMRSPPFSELEKNATVTAVEEEGEDGAAAPRQAMMTWATLSQMDKKNVSKSSSIALTTGMRKVLNAVCGNPKRSAKRKRASKASSKASSSKITKASSKTTTTTTTTTLRRARGDRDVRVQQQQKKEEKNVCHFCFVFLCFSV